jgi:hypothetical protein
VRWIEPLLDIQRGTRETDGQPETGTHPPAGGRDRGPRPGPASATSAAFVIAAVVVGAANVVSPFERGWWLTAYLFLVGGLAQLLLVRGQEALTTGPHHPSAFLVWVQWGLWNLGTAVVAVADMAQVMAAVDVGSVVLLVALVLFHLGARRPGATAGRHASALGCGYTALLVVLGSCVLLGTFFAGALPGQ